ncbi:hypothetical protein [Hyphomicrobium sp. 99]|uniref:hypothetical protein n=1 Tax=Hyphomicrobium sp. 99 TaxID=1163419 RepID=UPI0005F878FA|nr:hypothetical protein [Hyphomicrobium sp. 99]
MENYRAIVIVERSINQPMRFCDTRHKRSGSAYVFGSYGEALAFVQGTKVNSVVIEFDVEADTLDFCDAVKALKVPIVVSANSLEPQNLTQFGISGSSVFYPAGATQRKAS